MMFIVSFSAKGCELAFKIAEGLQEECRIFSKTSSDSCSAERIDESISDWTGKAFKEAEGIIFVGATGIAVRSIALHLRGKTVDPAVVCVDENGRYSISLISGHIGGANRLAERVASVIGSEVVITTATDINKKFSVDLFAKSNNMYIGDMVLAKEVSAAILDGKPVGFKSEYPLIGELPQCLTLIDNGELGIHITNGNESLFRRTLRLYPRNHVLGIGCRKDISKNTIEKSVMSALDLYGISIRSVNTIASIDIKSNEGGLLEFAEDNGIPVIFFSSEELNALPDGGFSSSEFVKETTGVDCVCERSAIAASTNGELIVNKVSDNGVTVAVVREPFEIHFGDE
ncbi:MAG TPA: cobalt-precorrin 5A hydrolase [Candidatus Methanomethylophilaceae archaeon]|nr:cobalt-precorrin 5A hydrolase [Candidatus Methanomethylophilaceae archaeon]